MLILIVGCFLYFGKNGQQCAVWKMNEVEEKRFVNEASKQGDHGNLLSINVSALCPSRVRKRKKGYIDVNLIREL